MTILNLYELGTDCSATLGDLLVLPIMNWKKIWLCPPPTPRHPDESVITAFCAKKVHKQPMIVNRPQESLHFLSWTMQGPFLNDFNRLLFLTWSFFTRLSARKSDWFLKQNAFLGFKFKAVVPKPWDHFSKYNVLLNVVGKLCLLPRCHLGKRGQQTTANLLVSKPLPKKKRTGGVSNTKLLTYAFKRPILCKECSFFSLSSGPS